MEDNHTGLNPTCREVHRLTSEGLDRDLSLVERARMRLHLLVCEACRNFTTQMQLLRQAMRRLAHGDQAGSEGEPK
jgi:predicted anti-sigma-YlaC factor YlaD